MNTTSEPPARDVKQAEEHFHDDWAASLDPADVMVDQSWQAATCPEHRWLWRQVGGDVRGKRVLDLGCGAGEAAVWFAKNGAHVVASDLSGEFLDLVRRVAALHGTSLETFKADADHIALPDGSFDIVYAGNLLHHVDTAKTLDQIHRLLKPGGVALTWDPLAHNPVINKYRKMASEVRTDDEHPLRITDLKLFKDRFRTVRADYFWFSALAIFLKIYLIERVHPSQARYWKKIIAEHERYDRLFRSLDRIDRVALRLVPYFRRHCWNVAVCATK